MKSNIVNVEISEQKKSSYPIYIGQNILSNIGELVLKHTKAKKVVVVTNTTIDQLYSDVIKASLEKQNIDFKFVVLSDGEKYKNFDSYKQIMDESLNYKLERKDAFIALGGGVIGDITGFAASSYLRGIDFIQIPTTLLAQVDSSVGGKVAINHSTGKNLIGAFYQPKFVLADTETLQTLPVRELKTGLAEVIKYGFIESTCGLKETINFIEYLDQNKDNIYNLEKNTIEKIVEYCCKLKAAVVNQDEKEAGLRAILNFGHTIAHAIEKCTHYTRFTHGEAVVMGIKGAFYIAIKENLIEKNYIDSSIELIKKFDLEYKIPQNIDTDSLIEAMGHDKKVVSNKKRFILSTGKAQVKIFNNISNETIENALKELY